MRKASPALRYWGLAAAVVAISFSSIFIKLSSAPALAIASNRMLLAVLLLLPATLLSGRSELLRMSRKDLLYLAWSGAFLALHFGLWTVSLVYTSVASSVVFVSTHPIFVALAEHFLLGEPVPLGVQLGIILTIIGSIAIGLNDLRIGGQSLYGDALAVGGAVAMTGYLLIGRNLRQHLGFLVYSTLVYGACWLGLLAASLALGVNIASFTLKDLVLFLALAAVCTVGGHTVFNWALRHVPASLVAVAFVGEPAGSSFLAWIILGQQISALTAIGGALILAGIYIAAQHT